MRVKITSIPQPSHVKITSLPEQQEAPEGFLGAAKRIGTATGLKGVENIENIAGLAKSGLLGLGSLFGMQEPKLHQQLGPQPAISEILQQKSGYTPEQLQPQNAAENFIQRFGSQAPINALFGGLPGVASTALGSGAAAGAGALGAPEGLQDVIQLGTEIGHGIKRGRIPTVSGQQKKAYEAATTAAGKNRANIAPIQNAITDIEHKLAKETTKKVSEEVTHALKIVDQNLNKFEGKLKLKDAMDLRRKLGETYEKVSSHSKPYIEQLRKSMNQFFAESAGENPEFYKILNEADQLTAMKHMRTSVDKFADLLVDKIPGAVGSTSKILVKLFGTPTLGFLEKIGRNTLENPTARKHYFNAVKAASTQNTPLFVNSLKKLKASTED